MSETQNKSWCLEDCVGGTAASIAEDDCMYVVDKPGEGKQATSIKHGDDRGGPTRNRMDKQGSCRQTRRVVEENEMI